VPLGELAEIRTVEAPAQISREDGMRRVVVECNIRGRDSGSFAAEVREKLEPVVSSLPPGYSLRYGGQFENQERAMRRLGLVVPVSVGLIFLLLFSAFGRMRSALLVFANLPFALVGGVLPLWIAGIPLSVSSIVGFIVLFGVAVQNGTVLVSFFERLRAEGLAPLEAVRRGCDLRFRPLLMTTATTVLGLLPMLLATGSGSEIQRPIAAVVLGGLVTSQLLTLLVLPVLFLLAEGSGRKREGA
ncbi:MAG: efflux RND transporter permease subunit, partial [Candidatus Eisenbacteria bacterium]